MCNYFYLCIESYGLWTIRIMETRNEIRPYVTIHPGAILKAELKERGIRQNAFAKEIGMQPTHLNALLQGNRNISPQLAIRLEKALDIPAHIWMNLQENYNLDHIRTADLVEGYSIKQEVPQLALADEHDKNDPVNMYREGYKNGRNDLINELLPRLMVQGYSKEEALSLLGLTQ